MSNENNRRQFPSGGEISFFQSNIDNTTIRYGLWPATSSEPKGTVICLPGRTEFIEKFYEVVCELRARGYAVAAMDWRGQGLSTRPLANREKHYFKDFSTALPDLAQFIEEIVQTKMPKPIHLLAHSMGGHLSLRFLHDYPGLVSKAIMTAPMVGINFNGVPKWVVDTLASLMCKLGRKEDYVQGFGDYKDGRWGWRMKLTSDLERFEDEDYFIKHDRDLAVGGITFGWVRAARTSIKKLLSQGYPEAIENKILILQAGNDEIVDNAMMDNLVARLAHGEKVLIPESKHEILKEQDHFRDQFWAAFDKFMS